MIVCYNHIKGILFFVLSSFFVQGFSQTTYTEFFDTVPNGSKQIVFTQLLPTDEGDSIYILSINNRRYFGDLDTAISPIYESNNGVLTLVGWDTNVYYPVDSTGYGSLIAKCDTASLTCDTAGFYTRNAYEIRSTPVKLLDYSSTQLLAIVDYTQRFPDNRIGIDSNVFFYIDKKTLAIDSSKTFTMGEMPAISRFVLRDAVINPQTGRVFLSGWILFEKDGIGLQGVVIKLDHNLNIQSYKAFYPPEDFAGIDHIALKNNMLYFYGDRRENFPESSSDMARSHFLGVIDVTTDSLLSLTPSFEQWSTQMYSFINSAQSILLNPSSDTLFTLSRNLSVIKPEVSATGATGIPILTAYNSLGQELWNMKYEFDDPSHDTVYDYFPKVFNFTADSNIFILGLRLTAPRDSRFDFFTMVVDKNDGSLIHSHIYEDSPDLWDKQYMAGSLLLSNGNILTGGYLSSSSMVGFLQKYNSKGCRGYCIEQDTTGIRQFSPPQVTAFHYPNPARENLHFSGINNCDGCKIQFFDISGKLTLETRYEKTVTVANLSKGLHLLRVVNQNGEVVYTGKSIIK